MATVQVLFFAGADEDATDSKMRTPLHIAAACGRVEIVKAMIAMGADTDARDDDGKTALDWAESEGHAEVSAVLR